MTISIDMLHNARACEHKENHHSTHCTFFSCVVHAFHPHIAENGVLMLLWYGGIRKTVLNLSLNAPNLDDWLCSETDIPGTSLSMHTYTGPLSLRCYMIRCSTKVHNQENKGACVSSRK